MHRLLVAVLLVINDDASAYTGLTCYKACGVNSQPTRFCEEKGALTFSMEKEGIRASGDGYEEYQNNSKVNGGCYNIVVKAEGYDEEFHLRGYESCGYINAFAVGGRLNYLTESLLVIHRGKCCATHLCNNDTEKAEFETTGLIVFFAMMMLLVIASAYIFI